MRAVHGHGHQQRRHRDQRSGHVDGQSAASGSGGGGLAAGVAAPRASGSAARSCCSPRRAGFSAGGNDFCISMNHSTRQIIASVALFAQPVVFRRAGRHGGGNRLPPRLPLLRNAGSSPIRSSGSGMPGWGSSSTGESTPRGWEASRGPSTTEDTTYEAYMAQASSFTAANYHPDQWAKLFAEAGARYAVLTSKHHDGFALWDTKLSKLNAKDGSPAGRDLVGPYCEALPGRDSRWGSTSRISTGRIPTTQASFRPAPTFGSAVQEPLRLPAGRRESRGLEAFSRVPPGAIEGVERALQARPALV